MITQQPLEVTRNNQTIRGQIYLPDSASIQRRCPAVLFLHGFTGQRMEPGFMYVYLARQLAHKGIAAVTFDFRNSGESDGHFSQMLPTQELDDALIITDHLAHIPVIDRSRLGLLGFSLGGLIAACTIAKTNIFKTLVLIAPTTVENICRYATPSGTPADAVLSDPISIGPLNLNPDFFTNVKKLKPLTDCVQNPRPTLIIQGTGDQAVTPAVSQKYADSLNQAAVPLTEHIINDADHTFASPLWRDDLFETITTWTIKHLT